MKIEITVDIYFSKGADVSYFDEEVDNENWGLNCQNSDLGIEMKAEIVKFIKDYDKYVFEWSLSSQEVRVESVKRILESLANLLYCLEDASNYNYLHVDKNYNKPQFAFIFTEALVDGVAQGLEVFKEFNERNEILKGEF